MSKKPEPDFDSENPEWTEVDFGRAQAPELVLPPEVLAAFPKTAMRIGRPPKPNKKQMVNLRLDPEVVASFRATGPGWQSRINDVLRKSLRQKAAKG